MRVKDLDFDELDKAINNVLGDKEARVEAAAMSAAQAAPPPSPNTLATPPGPVKGETPEKPPADRVQGRPSAATANLPTRKSLARPSTPAARRGVIDIMSPPSKSPSRLAAPVQPVHGHGVQLATGTPSDTAASQPRAAADLSPAERTLRWPPKPGASRPQEPQADPSEAAKLAPTSDQPLLAEAGSPPEPQLAAPTPAAEDTFERFDAPSHSSFNLEGDKVEAGESQPHAANQVSEEPPLVKPETTLPASSPFLSDAKVEKRPLGGYTPSAPSPDLAPAEPATTVAAEASPQPEPSLALANDHPLVAEAVPENAHTGVKLDHLLSNGHEHSGEPKPAEASATSRGSLQSIPQQYKTQDQKKSNEAPRPVFDTSEYHAPMQDRPPARHSSAGIWIAFSVIILLAIAGGLFIYFFGNQLGL